MMGQYPVPDLLQQFDIDQVFVSSVMLHAKKKDDPAARALWDALHDAGMPIEGLAFGDRLSFPGSSDRAGGDRVTLEVFHPPAEGVPGSDNANSLVVAVEGFGRRILLTGDLEKPGLGRLVAMPPYDVDVVLAPHHGSSASSPSDFAGWMTPEWVIVSGGFRSDIRRLELIYGEKPERTLHTAARGAVRVTIDRADLRVETLGRPLRRHEL